MFEEGKVNDEFVNKAVNMALELIKEYDASVRDVVAVGSILLSWALGEGFKMCTKAHDPNICIISLQETMREIFRIIMNATKLAMVIK